MKSPQSPGWNPRSVLFLGLWTGFLLLIYLTFGGYSVHRVNDFRNEANRRHQERLDPHRTEAHLTQPEEVSKVESTRVVEVGLYLDHVSALSMDSATWSPGFYLWFRWTGNGRDPGETFRLMEGQIEQKEKLEEITLGDTHYTRYFVRATLSKNFSVSLFPVEQHLMTLSIEDGLDPIQSLRLHPDQGSSNVSSRAHFPGFRIREFTLVEKPHSYKTDFGKSPNAARGKVTHDEVILGVTIERKGFGLYVKYFIGLFSATLIALVAFFIKPTEVDPRFGLGVGGFFGAVANALLSDNFVGQADSLSFIDIINAVGLVTIFLSIVESTLALYLYDIRGNRALSRQLDLLSALILGGGFITLIILLPLVACWE